MASFYTALASFGAMVSGSITGGRCRGRGSRQQAYSRWHDERRTCSLTVRRIIRITAESPSPSESTELGVVCPIVKKGTLGEGEAVLEVMVNRSSAMRSLSETPRRRPRT